jgi:serine/threonine-protein kinase TNNI3K
LADFLQILPENLVVYDIHLLNDRPVQYGGFADIYHGQYTNSNGEEVQVALKVLKVFQDQSGATRLLILQKFAKEALIWHYLRHPNIVTFIGVDTTTFPAPMMAMVSSWMSQGNVLKYMRDNEFPTSRYAIPLVCGLVAVVFAKLTLCDS